MGYLTAFARTDLGGHLNYSMRNLIEKWFQTLKMRLIRFHTLWMGSRASAARWAGAQGEQYVPVDPNRAATGATVSWVVEDIAESGDYEFHLRYASDAENNGVPSDTPRTAAVRVNDSTSKQITVPPTTYWDEWGNSLATISLESGENTVSVGLTDGDTGGFNLDSIAVTSTGEAMPEPPNCPDSWSDRR